MSAVLFDYGHTLVDFRRTEEALLDAYGRIRDRVEAALHIDVPEVAHLIDRVAREIDRLVEASYQERRLEELDIVAIFDETLRSSLGVTVPPDVVQHVVALDHSAYSQTITVSKEALEALERLRERGLKLGLVSNVALLPQLMREDLEALGLMSHLDVTVFSSEVGSRKPDPRIFEHALARLGISGSSAAFVGDRLLDDVWGARQLGMRTILTREFRREEGGEVEPDATVDRIADIVPLVEAWL